MSSSRLAELREKSKKRKEYLKVTLGVDNLAEALGSDVIEPVTNKRKNEIIEEKQKHSKNGVDSYREEDNSDRSDPEAGQTEFRDSTAFLKGTQSMNPHNDYSQNFVDTGQRPQNFIRDTGDAIENYGYFGTNFLFRSNRKI